MTGSTGSTGSEEADQDEDADAGEDADADEDTDQDEEIDQEEQQEDETTPTTPTESQNATITDDDEEVVQEEDMEDNENDEPTTDVSLQPTNSASGSTSIEIALQYDHDETIAINMTAEMNAIHAEIDITTFCYFGRVTH